MEDWHDIAFLIAGSLSFAAVGSIVVSVLVYAIVWLGRLLRKKPSTRTWRNDLRLMGIFGSVLLLIILIPSLYLAVLTSNMCGTSDITEVPSPDGKHKIAVYNFDCGATTSFSLDVSLLRAEEKLPKYRTATLIYSHYRQLPIASGKEKNFEVSWKDSGHVTVRALDFEGQPTVKKQDGIEVRMERLLAGKSVKAHEAGRESGYPAGSLPGSAQG